MDDQVFPGQIDMGVFEKNLRQAFEGLEGKYAGYPVMQCQARGVEASVQFALFVANELNNGTPASVLINGGSRLLGNMIENLARGFVNEDGTHPVTEIFDRIKWQTTNDASDDVVTANRPTTRGGHA